MQFFLCPAVIFDCVTEEFSREERCFETEVPFLMQGRAFIVYLIRMYFPAAQGTWRFTEEVQGPCTKLDLFHLCTLRAFKYKPRLAPAEMVLITLATVSWLETNMQINDQERYYLFVVISQARSDLRDKSNLFPYLVLLGFSNPLVCQWYFRICSAHQVMGATKR